MVGIVQFGSATDVGLVRQRNEDSLLVDADRGLFVVADGLGGHPAGHVASRMAIDGIDERLTSVRAGDETPRDLIDALRRAHDQLLRGMEEDPSRLGMGTTAVLAYVPADGDEIWVAHVGDSRAYLVQGGTLQQLTDDHTTGGPFTRGNISQALGTSGEISPDIRHLKVQEGDRLLLCTDGLTDMVGDPQIERTLGDGLDAQAACDQLVSEAREHGGADNITVIVVDLSR